MKKLSDVPREVLRSYFASSELGFVSKGLRSVTGDVSALTVVLGGRRYLAWARRQGFDLEAAVVGAARSPAWKAFYSALFQIDRKWCAKARFNKLVSKACETAVIADNAECLAWLVSLIEPLKARAQEASSLLRSAVRRGSLRCLDIAFDSIPVNAMAFARAPDVVEHLEKKTPVSSAVVSMCLDANNLGIVPWWITARGMAWPHNAMACAVSRGGVDVMAEFAAAGAPLTAHSAVVAVGDRDKLEWLLARGCPVEIASISAACGRRCADVAVFDDLTRRGLIDDAVAANGAVATDNAAVLRRVHEVFGRFPTRIAIRAAKHDAADCLEYLKRAGWSRWEGVPEAAIETDRAFAWTLKNIECDTASLVQAVRTAWRHRSINELYPKVLRSGTREQLGDLLDTALRHPHVCAEIIAKHPERVARFLREATSLKTKVDILTFAETYNIYVSASWTKARAVGELVKRHALFLNARADM